jgi:hypothetical protein
MKALLVRLNCVEASDAPSGEPVSRGPPSAGALPPAPSFVEASRAPEPPLPLAPPGDPPAPEDPPDAPPAPEEPDAVVDVVLDPAEPPVAVVEFELPPTPPWPPVAPVLGMGAAESSDEQAKPPRASASVKVRSCGT